MKNSVAVPPKLNTEFPRDLANLLLGAYPEELKAGAQRNVCTLTSLTALCTITKVSTDGWTGKPNAAHPDK